MAQLEYNFEALFDLPLVSVVITNYNYGRYLLGSVESVFSQTYPNIECIVVDDASTDDSACVIEGLKEKFPALIMVMRETNAGQCSACRDGLEASQGEYIIFLDADDFLLPECIETHIFVHLSMRLPVGMTSCDMLQSSGGRIVTGGFIPVSHHMVRKKKHENVFRRIDRSAPRFWRLRGVPGHIENDIRLIHSGVLAGELDYRPYKWAGTSGNCFRREIVALFLRSRYLHVHRYGADGYLVRAVSMCTGSVIIDRPLVVYRIHGENGFSVHPQIAGLDAFARADLANLDRATWRMTLDHLVDNANLFTERMPPFRFADMLEVLWKSCTDTDFGDECSVHFQHMISRNAEQLLKSMDIEIFGAFLARVGIKVATLDLPVDEGNAIEREMTMTFARHQQNDAWCMVIPFPLREQIAKLMSTIGRWTSIEGISRSGAKLWNRRFETRAIGPKARRTATRRS